MDLKTKRFALILLSALFIFSLFGSLNLISAADPSSSGGDTTYNIYSGDIVDTDHGAGKILGFLNLTGTWRQIILGLLILLIVFAAMYDILLLLSIFPSRWVKILLAAAIAIAAALTNIIHKIAVWFATVAAGLGVAAIFIEIVICIVIFVGLSFGSNWFAKFAARRKAAVAEATAIEGSGRAKAAITGLENVQEGFEGAASRGRRKGK
jgi:presenilin-like A22 family membrane protease